MHLARPIVNRIGQRFGRLVVRSLVPRSAYEPVRFLCDCDCGGTKIARSHSLAVGNTRSCGCMTAELLRTTTRPRPKHGHARRGKHTVTYDRWMGMVGRCHGEGPTRHQYAYYRDRGISVWPEWRADYLAFLRDMGECPDGHSIDRIDNDRGYEPGNCRWVPIVRQSYNRRSTVWIEYDGHRDCLAVACRATGVPKHRVQTLRDQGLTPQTAFDRARWELSPQSSAAPQR